MGNSFSGKLSPCLWAHPYEAIGPLTMGEILNEAKLSDKDLKLRLRIGDYAVLNLYSWNTQHTRKI
jgi:hypothetical protein